jgi:hypothetical protein
MAAQLIVIGPAAVVPVFVTEVGLVGITSVDRMSMSSKEKCIVTFAAWATGVRVVLMFPRNEAGTDSPFTVTVAVSTGK